MSHPKILIIFVLIVHATSVHTLTEADLFPHKESDGSRIHNFGSGYGVLRVNFASPFTLFNKTYKSIIISAHGYVEFGPIAAPVRYASSCSPETRGQTIVLSFWSHASQTYGAKLLYMETSWRSFLLKARNDIISAFPEFKIKPLDLTGMFIVTWKNIPSYDFPNAAIVNTAQLALVHSKHLSFAIFYYIKIEWVSAYYGHHLWGAGFDFGDGRPLYLLQGSCTDRFRDIANSSNIGGVENKGKFVFAVQSSLRLPGEQIDNFSGEQILQFQPNIVSVMGNVPILVSGLLLDSGANCSILCRFHDLSLTRPSETSGIVVGDGGANGMDGAIGLSLHSPSVICPVPFLYFLCGGTKMEDGPKT